jgi:hypothetical protein
MNFVQYGSIIAYGIGSLTWIYFLPGNLLFVTIVPNIITLGIGILLLIIPTYEIFNYFVERKYVFLNYE